MTASTSSLDVEKFLQNAIDSFEKLEVVRCLWSPGSPPWTIDQLAERVGTSSDHLEPSLAELAAVGLVGSGPTRGEYIAPRTSIHAAMVDELLVRYREDPLAIIRVINKLAVERIRTMAARTFADSFVVKPPRKPEPDDG